MKIIIAASILTVSLVVSLLLWYKNDQKDVIVKVEPATSTQEVVIPKRIEEKMVRSTFFHAAPVMGSLAIPEKWEGHYRFVDGGTAAIFQFIDNPTNSAYIFQINYYKLSPDGKFSAPAGEKEITRKNDIVFTYKKADKNPYSGKDGEKFSQMLDQVDAMMLEFKAIKY